MRLDNRGTILIYQRVQCGATACNNIDEKQGSRSALRKQIVSEGWAYNPKYGWLCPIHSGSQENKK